VLTERGELLVRKERIFMDWLPPIEVSRISDGGKMRPHKELFLLQSDFSVRYGLTLFFLFESSFRLRSSYSSLHSLRWRNPYHRRPAHYALHEGTFLCMTSLLPQVE